MTTSAAPLDWERAPLAAFARFVVSPEFRATGKPRYHHTEARLLSTPSAKVYISMFGRFMVWLQAQPRVSLRTLGEAHLRAFLAIADEDGRPRLASNIAYRYLRLLDRVLSHLGRQPNPARHLLEELRARQHGAAAGATVPADRDMVALQDEALARFMAALPDAAGNPASGCKRPYAPWKRARDRALLCMIAGAGLKPAEAIGLRLEEFDPTPQLAGEHAGYFILNLKPAGKHATSFGHTTYLDPAFAGEVLAWLALRARCGIAGELMFPSTRKGKALSAATVYLLVKHTFERAGIDAARAGGRTLRNSYAVREIGRAVERYELKAMLGLALEQSTRTYFEAAQRLAKDKGK